MSPSHFDMRRAWDRAAAGYLARRDPQVDTVSYGALAPDERTLHLLGDLAGRRVLDLGCGPGHNAVACARAGAQVTALDLSAVQLDLARELARREQVTITFVQADAAALRMHIEPSYDLILAVQILGYLPDPAPCLAACRDLLAPCGRFVASLDHPLRDCFLDPEEGITPYPVRSYADPSLLTWTFADDLPMRSYHWPLAGWFQWLHESRLTLHRLLEPPAPRDLLDDLWPEDSPLSPLRLIPHTLIWVAAPAQV